MIFNIQYHCFVSIHRPVDNINTQTSETYAAPNISPTPVIYDECYPPINNEYEIIRKNL